jgi:hypothetical protein
MQKIRVRPRRRKVRTRVKTIQLTAAQRKRRTPDNPLGLTELQFAAQQNGTKPRTRRASTQARRTRGDQPKRIIEMIDVCCACGHAITERDTGHRRGCRMKIRATQAQTYRMTAIEKRRRNIEFLRKDGQRRRKRQEVAA